MNRGTRRVTIDATDVGVSDLASSPGTAVTVADRLLPGAQASVDRGPQLLGSGDVALGAAQMQAWRAFLVAHSWVTRRLEEDLMSERQLPLAMYDVLVQLAEAPGRRLRMTELAEAVLLSRSGLTRLVDRMVRQGHVHREPSPSDARGVFAVLTDAGLQCLREAGPTHLRGISAYLLQHLDEDELAALGRACTKVVDGLAAAEVDDAAVRTGPLRE